ncbi:hypothetical protein GW17_00031154 [Ensete ventricosum]|nr:hypothetical protein GW17_00031154 [Ensete ventricosum]
MDHPYQYPHPYGYQNPPPSSLANPSPYEAPHQSPHPPYLYTSNSFPSPPPPNPSLQFTHSGPIRYPPPPSYHPPAAPFVAPTNYSYDPYFFPPRNPQPYIYPHTIPYEPAEPAVLSAQLPVSSSSSIYPINNHLANVHLADQTLPPDSSHHRWAIHNYQRQSFSGSLSSVTPFARPPATPSRESQHGAIVLLLHGSLDIWVYEAENLPNMDLFHKTLGDMFGPRITSTISGKVEHVTSITSDPYVTINVCDAAIGRTYVVSNSENPVWMQHFSVPVAHHAAEVEFLVKDSDVLGAQLIGSVSIPTMQIYSGEKVEGTYPILCPNGKQCKPGAVLRLSIQYIPMERLCIYHHGVGAGPDHCGVPGTYFPLRKGGKVTLYQDAHVPDGYLPDLMLGNGMYYEHGKCWHDICDAIINARRLIYIIGWSVFHTVRLIREAGNSSSPILGDLLKSKSQEGVRVLLLVWDDPTSRNILGYRTVRILFISPFCFAFRRIAILY